jgi:hypothetical protein
MSVSTFFHRFLAQATQIYQEFVGGGYIPIYRLIFRPAQFPIWSTVQAFWCCRIVHASMRNQPRSTSNLIRQFLLSAAMTFGPRELYARCFEHPSPLYGDYRLFLVFLGIFALIHVIPYDIFYKITSFFVVHYFLGLLQGFNQARFFALILRLEKNDSPLMLLIAVSLLIGDQVIEVLGRILTRGEVTHMSNGANIFRTVIFSTAFWMATHRSRFSRYIGKWNVQVAGLVLGFALGIANASTIIGSAAVTDFQRRNRGDRQRDHPD